MGVALKSRDKLQLLRGVGVTNQRETTILWDRMTGEQLAPAVVWCDGRTGDLVEQLIGRTATKSKDALRVGVVYTEHAQCSPNQFVLELVILLVPLKLAIPKSIILSSVQKAVVLV